MGLEAILNFLTSKTGIVAAVGVVIGIVGGVVKIVLPLLKQRQEKQASLPELSLSPVRITDPPPWSEAGTAAFELMNTRGGKAVMSDLRLVVTKCGVSERPKLVEPAAPVPQFTYKVTLSPGVTEYDVRKKEFGAPAPHSYEKQEVEALLVELRSTEPQWYEFYFLVRWYDAQRPQEIFELKSAEGRIEFRPSVEDLLA